MSAMRRAQSVRTYPRASISLSTDQGPPSDLYPLPEDPTTEDALRRQLLEKDREIDKLQDAVLNLQTALAARPPLSTIQTLEKEYRNLDLILQGTQRENERCMAEIERGRTRERALEQALARIAGENWQNVLDIAPSATVVARAVGSSLLNRTPVTPPPPSEASDSPPATQASIEATLSQMEQIRLLVLGMEQRMQEREEKLTKTIERAETQETKCDALRKEVSPPKIAA